MSIDSSGDLSEICNIGKYHTVSINFVGGKIKGGAATVGDGLIISQLTGISWLRSKKYNHFFLKKF